MKKPDFLDKKYKERQVLLRETMKTNNKRNKCYHHWIYLSLELTRNGKHVGDWYWCNLCGATKHIVEKAGYFGLDKNGVYIRHIGKNSKAFLHVGW